MLLADQRVQALPDGPVVVGDAVLELRDLAADGVGVAVLRLPGEQPGLDVRLQLVPALLQREADTDGL